MSDPVVSIIIPTYKRNKYLQRCLDSVINQSYENIEIIVIDDSGYGHAAPIVPNKQSISYIELSENQGPNKARNIGIESASGKYIQLLDDDDYILDRKIEKQVDLMENNDIGVSYCAVRYESGEIITPDPDGRGDVLRKCLELNLTSCNTLSMLIKREILIDILPLPDVDGSDDTYWKIEFALRTKFDYCSEVLAVRGEPEDQRTQSWGVIEGTWGILENYSELYANHPSSVRDKAISRAAHREANYLIYNNTWSLGAILKYTYAIWKDPNPSLYLWGLAVGSLFGKHGQKKLISSGKYIIEMLSSKNKNL